MKFIWFRRWGFPRAIATGGVGTVAVNGHGASLTPTKWSGGRDVESISNEPDDDERYWPHGRTVLVYNTMAFSVTQHRKEIGILRSLGLIGGHYPIVLVEGGCWEVWGPPGLWPGSVDGQVPFDAHRRNHRGFIWTAIVLHRIDVVGQYDHRGDGSWPSGFRNWGMSTGLGSQPVTASANLGVSQVLTPR